MKRYRFRIQWVTPEGKQCPKLDITDFLGETDATPTHDDCCEHCGQCLACYGDDECPDNDVGWHSWSEYFEEGDEVPDVSQVCALGDPDGEDG